MTLRSAERDLGRVLEGGELGRIGEVEGGPRESGGDLLGEHLDGIVVSVVDRGRANRRPDRRVEVERRSDPHVRA